MRKLYLTLASCVALVAFLGFSASAYADHIVEPDCDGDPYDNSFALNGFEIATWDDIAFNVADLTVKGVVCGTVMDDNLRDCGEPPIGEETLTEHIDIKGPRGVEINSTSEIEDGAYTGYAKVNVAFCAEPFSQIVEDENMVVRADDTEECIRENNDMKGGPVEGTIVACHRVEDIFVILGHAWIWHVRDDSGRYTTVIGPLHPIFGEAGITSIKNLTFCERVGDVNGNDCGDDSRPWLQKNGDASYPDCDNGNGIFTATATNKRGDTTDPTETCVEWDVVGSYSVDLLNEANIRIDGAEDTDLVGISVANAGDVNGDSRPDVIVGATGRREEGAAYVIFGSRRERTIDLSRLGRKGFRIEGAASGDRTGYSVSGAGDVNGDNLDDVIVSAPEADNNGREGSGSAYVVFGKETTKRVKLAKLGRRGNTQGFRIDGGASRDFAGYSVSGAGDVNGDDLDDVVVGASRADNNGREGSGSAYVVFGKETTEKVKLDKFGRRNNTQGFRIDGAARGDSAGDSVAGAGDVNGDDLDDLIVGAPYAYNSYFASGSAYVIFGKASTTTVDLAQLGDGGFRIDGAAPKDFAGDPVAGAGDVNGDELDDVVVIAPHADNNGRDNSGSAYVIFGKASTTTVDLAQLGDGGFRIDGATEEGWAGWSAGGAGDVNGDNLDDVIVGAAYASNNGREESGSAYVVYGKASTENIDLARPREAGFRIDGAARGDTAGGSVAGAGDVNGDGLDDVIIGAAHASNNGRSYSGSAYIVFGF